MISPKHDIGYNCSAKYRQILILELILYYLIKEYIYFQKKLIDPSPFRDLFKKKNDRKILNTISSKKCQNNAMKQASHCRKPVKMKIKSVSLSNFCWLEVISCLTEIFKMWYFVRNEIHGQLVLFFLNLAFFVWGSVLWSAW